MNNYLSAISNIFNDTPLAFIRAVPFEQLVFDPRAEYMCKYGCKNYSRTYSCPPQSLELFFELQRYKYKWAILFATTHAAPNNITAYKFRNLNRLKEYEIQRLCRQIGLQFCTNGSDNLLLSGGSCKACRVCSLSECQPCKKPELRQVSMEAIGIDCQKTLSNAGFGFQMPNTTSINRCGCLLTNDDNLALIHLQKCESLQTCAHPDKTTITETCGELLQDFPQLFEDIKLINISDIPIIDPPCEHCSRQRLNFACPPYSSPIPINEWFSAVLWKWKPNTTKKNRYNAALKTIHSAFFSKGFYFALSLRDCYCDECIPCNYINVSSPICASRKTLAASMQSQGINPGLISNGRIGIELL